MMGIGLAGFSLLQRRVEVGGSRPLRAEILRWLKTRFRRPVEQGTKVVNPAVGGVEVHETVVKHVRNATSDDRIAALEQSVKDVADAAARDRGHLKDEIRKARGEAAQGQHATGRRIEDMDERIRLLAREGVALEVLGLWWVALGVVGPVLIHFL